MAPTDDVATWAQTAIWHSDRSAFLDWYATHQPDATGWAAFALYAADTGTPDELHDRHHCGHCHTGPAPVTARLAGPATVSPFQQGAA